MNKEKLLNALKVIVDTCNEYDDEGCYSCPLYTTSLDSCKISDETESPAEWHINFNNSIWRALE